MPSAGSGNTTVSESGLHNTGTPKRAKSSAQAVAPAPPTSQGVKGKPPIAMPEKPRPHRQNGMAIARPHQRCVMRPRVATSGAMRATCPSVNQSSARHRRANHLVPRCRKAVDLLLETGLNIRWHVLQERQHHRVQRAIHMHISRVPVIACRVQRQQGRANIVMRAFHRRPTGQRHNNRPPGQTPQLSAKSPISISPFGRLATCTAGTRKIRAALGNE